jgi:hypothetical protein
MHQVGARGIEGDVEDISTYWEKWLDHVDDRLNESWRLDRILNM